MKKNRLITLSLAGVLIASALAGCSSSGDTSAESSGQTAAAQSAEASSEDTGSSDGKVYAWNKGDNVYVDVPAKAGGGTDLYTRYLTQALSEVCPGVNFIVNNYETGEVGLEHFKNADPDGLTLGVTHGGSILSYISGTSNVHIMDDLRVVGTLNQGGPQAIIASPDAPYTNLEEYGAYIKEHPGEVIVGVTLGSTSHVLHASVVEAVAGDMSLVNYVQCSSEADKLTNIASGSLDIANCSISNALNYDADGKITILGCIGPEAATIESMSELVGTELDAKYASCLEQGYDVTFSTSTWLFAPKDTPDEIAQAINEAVCAAVQTDAYKEGNNAMATFLSELDLVGCESDLAEQWQEMDTMLDAMGLKVR